LASGAFSKEFAQNRDVAVEIVLFHDRVWPHVPQQSFLCHQAAGILHKHQQRFEYFRSQRDRSAIAKQHALSHIKLKRSEGVNLRWCMTVGRICGLVVTDCRYELLE
jgi:hypothetical protein